MRAASGRFGLNLGRSNKDNSDKDGEPAQSGHGRVASGGGGANGGGLGAGELAKSVKGKIAHTTIVSIHSGNVAHTRAYQVDLRLSSACCTRSIHLVAQLDG